MGGHHRIFAGASLGILSIPALSVSVSLSLSYSLLLVFSLSLFSLTSFSHSLHLSFFVSRILNHFKIILEILEFFSYLYPTIKPHYKLTHCKFDLHCLSKTVFTIISNALLYTFNQVNCSHHILAVGQSVF